MTGLGDLLTVEEASSDAENHLIVFSLGATAAEKLACPVLEGTEVAIRLHERRMTVVNADGSTSGSWQPYDTAVDPEPLVYLWRALRYYVKKNYPDYYLE